MADGAYHAMEASNEYERTSHFLVAVYRLLKNPESAQQRADVLEYATGRDACRLNPDGSREGSLASDIDALLAGDESMWAPFLIGADGHYFGIGFFGGRQQFGGEAYLTQEEQPIFNRGARRALQSLSPFKDHLLFEVRSDHRWGGLSRSIQDDMREYFRSLIEDGKRWKIIDGDVFYVAMPTISGLEAKVGWLYNFASSKVTGPRSLDEKEEVEA